MSGQKTIVLVRRMSMWRGDAKWVHPTMPKGWSDDPTTKKNLDRRVDDTVRLATKVWHNPSRLAVLIHNHVG